MAYASFFDTHVTALRFKCLEWSVYLNSLNRDIDFQIYEDKENMKIDFEIVVRNTQGVNINSFLVNDIDVSPQLCNLNRNSLLSRIPVGVKIKVYNVFYTLIPSFIPIMMLFNRFQLQMSH